MMYCVHCGEIFAEPKHYRTYQARVDDATDEWDGCPYCASSFIVPVRRCDVCGEYATSGVELKHSHEFICSNCYEEIEVSS